MANNNQLRRYYLIYQCVKQRKYPSFTQIIQYLKENDIEVSERTFQRDIKMLRTDFHLPPEYNKETNGYYFESDDLKAASGAIRFLELAYLADNLSQKGFSKYISYGEADLLKGIEHVPLLLDAIDKQKVIEFEHENYQKGTITTTRLAPYLIREYLNRWYVVGYKTDSNELRTFGVDRISELRRTQETFERNENNNLNSLFDHVIGVVYDANKLIKLEFKIPTHQKKYFNSLPLHKSQLHLIDENDESHYQMEVVQNYELEQKLLMHSQFLTVTGPKDYAQYFAEKIKNISQRYK